MNSPADRLPRRLAEVLPDHRGGQQRQKDHSRLQVQLARLADKHRAHSYQSSLFTRIRDSRTPAGEPHDVEAIVRDGDFLVAMSGEVLVRSQQQGLAQAVLEPAGFGAGVPVPELQGRVVRFAKPGGSAAEASALVATLQAAGVQATLNYVVPLGYVAKGEGGFENSTVDPSYVGPGTAAGPGAKVAVIDTGASGEARNDGWLQNLTLAAGGQDSLYQKGKKPLLDFAAGHGTFVTGLIQQVAPTAQITTYGAVHSDGIGSELDIAAALLAAARGGAQVINLSLGTETVGDQPPVGIQVALEIMAEEHDDVLLVAAAGNSGSIAPTWPAAFDQVVAVASLTSGLRGSAWSNRGDWVDCSAIGEGIVSTYVEGNEDNAVDKTGPDVFGPSSWALGTGTSFAAPQVTGAIARLMDERGLSAKAALDALMAGPDAVVVPDAGYGTGLHILPGT